MSIVILILLVAVGIHLALGFGLAAIFFKAGPARTTAGIVIGIIAMVASTAIVYSACSSGFGNMH